MFTSLTYISYNLRITTFKSAFYCNRFPTIFTIFFKNINTRVKSKYGEVPIDSTDLKSVFRYFKTLSEGIASRNNTITSGVMETSGGSRLNYRSNTIMYDKNPLGNNVFGAVSSLDIIEG